MSNLTNHSTNQSIEGDLCGLTERVAKKYNIFNQQSTVQQSQETLAVEHPIAMVYNGISHAVMLATPSNLEDFALGFTLTEGIVNHAREILDIEVEHSVLGISLNITLVQQRMFQLKEKRRSLAGSTSCGLCGVDSLQQITNTLKPVSQRCFQGMSPQMIGQMVLQALQELQPLQVLLQQTGATHCAAWVNMQGHIQFIREDVGRHNTLDKLIGAAVKQNIQLDCGFVLMSSRASYELVQKSVVMGIPMLAVISAPTQLAVDMAAQSGQILAGFARGDRVTFYAGV